MILTLEQQVTSLELSKRLEELGIKRETIFYWYKFTDNYYGKKTERYEPVIYDRGLIIPEKICSAFTAVELLEIMPKRIELEDEIVELNILPVHVFGQGQWLTKFIGITNRNNLLSDKYSFIDVNLSNSIALKLIYLLEKKLIEASNESK